MHLRRHIKFSIVFFSVILGFAACSEKEKTEKYVVKINESVLTEDQIRAELADVINRGKTREEFINSWIEREILFQEALKDGIGDDAEYKSLIEKSRKELAAALFINKLLDKEKSEPAEDEIKKYYEANIDDFRLIDDAFLLNAVYFSDFEKAVRFRERAIESNWKNSLNSSKNDQSILSIEEAQFRFKYQLQPPRLIRIISDLEKDEVSVVIETEPGRYAVIKLLEKFEKDANPPFELVREEVKERITVIKKKEIIKEYIDKLIADHNLEIKRYSE